MTDGLDSGSNFAAGLTGIFESMRDINSNIIAERKELILESGSGSGSCPLEWCVDLSDCVVIAPRNSLSLDAIAVKVTSGTVQGMYVHESWSAPHTECHSEGGKCLFFDPIGNKWLFECDTPTPSESPLPVGRTGTRKDPKEGWKETGLKLLSPREIKKAIERSVASVSQLFPTDTDGEGEGEGEGKVEGSNEDEEDSSGEGEGEESRDGHRSVQSAISIASSLYQSCDDNDPAQLDVNVDGDVERTSGSWSHSGSFRSLRSRVSSNDGEDLFFDAYDDTTHIPPGGSVRDTVSEGKKAAVRFAIPPIPEGSKIPSPVHPPNDNDGATTAAPTVSRIVLTLHQADVYVSLASPLGEEEHGRGRGGERGRGRGGGEGGGEIDSNELRKMSAVFHRAPVYDHTGSKGMKVQKGRARRGGKRTEKWEEVGNTTTQRSL